MKKTFLILLLFSIASCKKNQAIRPYSIVQVKFIEQDNYNYIATTEGSWDPATRLAQLAAVGIKNERFNLYLPNLADTGNYFNPSVKNIYYADGLNFIPFKLNSGYIHVSYIDSLSVRGDFLISYSSDFNGYSDRTVTGNFGINFQ